MGLLKPPPQLWFSLWSPASWLAGHTRLKLLNLKMPDLPAKWLFYLIMSLHTYSGLDGSG